MAPKQASSNSPAGLMLALASDNTKKIKEQTNFKKKRKGGRYSKILFP